MPRLTSHTHPSGSCPLYQPGLQETEVGQGAGLTHPLRMMTMMAPRRRMRTASPPAQMPRMSPISSDLCDTSRGRLLSLQAAGEKEAGQQMRGERDHLTLPAGIRAPGSDQAAQHTGCGPSRLQSDLSPECPRAVSIQSSLHLSHPRSAAAAPLHSLKSSPTFSRQDGRHLGPSDPPSSPPAR